jgi:carboxypeptidase Q
VKGKALAIAFTSSREHDVLYRHINTGTGTIDVIPQVLLAREDAERIARLLAHGEKVSMSLSMPNRVGPPIRTANVVAELKGSDLANQVVILGAHLDSWELGTGALDNGCNAALVVDSLRAIKAAGVRPRRTIRFILFSGEEQGLLGSLAYVRAHRNELDNVVAELVLDAGSGPVTGFTTGGRKDVNGALTPMLQPFATWNANQLTNDAMTGTDHYDFMIEGVPTLVANQSEANYLVNYHATSDTFDKVDFRAAQEERSRGGGADRRIGQRATTDRSTAYAAANRNHHQRDTPRRADERLWPVGRLAERDKRQAAIIVTALALACVGQTGSGPAVEMRIKAKRPGSLC